MEVLYYEKICCTGSLPGALPRTYCRMFFQNGRTGCFHRETTAAASAESTSEAAASAETKSIDSLKIAFSPYADADTITTATEPLENLLKETLLEKGYDVKDIDMTVGTSYTAVGEALSAGSADIGFISGGTMSCSPMTATFS